jgi:hypothetical protein
MYATFASSVDLSVINLSSALGSSNRCQSFAWYSGAISGSRAQIVAHEPACLTIPLISLLLQRGERRFDIYRGDKSGKLVRWVLNSWLPTAYAAVLYIDTRSAAVLSRHCCCTNIHFLLSNSLTQSDTIPPFTLLLQLTVLSFLVSLCPCVSSVVVLVNFLTGSCRQTQTLDWEFSFSLVPWKLSGLVLSLFTMDIGRRVGSFGNGSAIGDQ